MNPINTLWLAIEHKHNGDRVEAMWCLMEYFSWRMKGGFEPQIRDEHGQVWNGDRFANALKEELR